MPSTKTAILLREGGVLFRRFFYIICGIFFCPFLLHAGTVRMINNSPYDLRAVIRGSDGSYLGEMVIRSQKESIWTDSYGAYGLAGGANPSVNQNYRSKTPYTVLWYCLDGADYAICDTVSTGAVVTSQGCSGSRMCKPKKKEAYPQEPEGHYLYQPDANLKENPPLNH